MDVRERAREWLDLPIQKCNSAETLWEVLDGAEKVVTDLLVEVGKADEEKAILVKCLKESHEAVKLLQSQLSRYTNAVEVEGTYYANRVDIHNDTSRISIPHEVKSLAQGQRVKVLVMAGE